MISTPRGFSKASTNESLGFNFEFDSRFGAQRTEDFKRRQKVVDSEVLRYNRPYVPFKQGTLMRSGDLYTVTGSGTVTYKTPYARRLYYNPQYRFFGAPMRGGRWFERMKLVHKKSILKAAQK